jgi:hypothetical protein
MRDQNSQGITDFSGSAVPSLKDSKMINDMNDATNHVDGEIPKQLSYDGPHLRHFKRHY